MTYQACFSQNFLPWVHAFTQKRRLIFACMAPAKPFFPQETFSKAS